MEGVRTIPSRNPEEKLFLLLEENRDGIVVVDEQGIVLFANQMAETLFGRQRDHLLGQPLGYPVIKGEKAELQVFTGQEESTVELYSMETRWEGEKAFLLSLRDITDKKQVETELLRFRMALDNAADSIFLIHYEDMRFLDFNETAVSELGYSRDELLQMGPHDIKPYLEEKELKKTFGAMMFGGQAINSLETVHRRKNGTDMPVEVYLRWQRFGDEDIIIATARDITQRKADEEKLADYAVELELNNLALEEAQGKIKENIQKAMQLHQQFLPRSFPHIPGITFAASYHPAENLGGDFYNVMKVGEECLLYLADVSGHGLDGAMLTIFIRETINSYLAFKHREGQALSPEDLMDYISWSFRRERFPEDYFICLFIGVFRPPDSFSYCSAGIQIPPILARGGEKIVALPTGGLPISPLIDAKLVQYEEYASQMLPGDTLLFTTDGLVEQEGPTGMYGEHRLHRALKAYQHLPPEIISRAIEEDFLSFHGELQGDDDITYLVMQRAPEPYREWRSVYPGTMETVELIQDKIVSFLDGLEDPEALYIGFLEILSNSLEHGSSLNPEKNIIIYIRREPSYLLISIEDEGRGFLWRDKMRGNLGIHSGRERGRGIVITQKIFDYVYYNDLGNKVSLIHCIGNE